MSKQNNDNILNGAPKFAVDPSLELSSVHNWVTRFQHTEPVIETEIGQFGLPRTTNQFLPNAVWPTYGNRHILEPIDDN